MSRGQRIDQSATSIQSLLNTNGATFLLTSHIRSALWTLCLVNLQCAMNCLIDKKCQEAWHTQERKPNWQARPPLWWSYCWCAASAAAMFYSAKSGQDGLSLWRPCLDTLFVNAIIHCTLLTMPKEVRLFSPT